MIRVTATDLETGESASKDIMDDYILVTAGNLHVAYVENHPNGTVQLTIKKIQVQG